MMYAIRCVITDLKWADENYFTLKKGWNDTDRGRERLCTDVYGIFTDLNIAYNRYHHLYDIMDHHRWYYLVEEVS